MAALHILRPGLLTTIQDLGRWGLQGRGVPPAGPMDSYSHRLANQLVGNDESAAALEITLLGPELQSDGDVLCAVTGASFFLTVDGQSVQMHRPFAVRAGQVLRFGERRHGARGALAVAGGIDVPPVLGSRATSLSVRMGPLPRPLAAGDRLNVLPRGASSPRDGAFERGLPMPRGGARLRVIPGPNNDRFPEGALPSLLATRYTVTPQSNRMGYRLGGDRLPVQSGGDILSEATPMGSIQVPGSGAPILLMADRQTTGGYPRIATVITADLPLAGQLAPGDWIEFAHCSPAEALEALRQREARLAGVPW